MFSLPLVGNMSYQYINTYISMLYVHLMYADRFFLICILY